MVNFSVALDNSPKTLGFNVICCFSTRSVPICEIATNQTFINPCQNKPPRAPGSPPPTRPSPPSRPLYLARENAPAHRDQTVANRTSSSPADPGAEGGFGNNHLFASVCLPCPKCSSASSAPRPLTLSPVFSAV